MDNVADALTKEVTRIQNVVIPAYQGPGPASARFVASMKADVAEAVIAVAKFNMTAMMVSLATLREYS